LTEIRGQSAVVNAMITFVASVDQDPCSAPFVFHGPTGTGKSCTAEAVANALGCAVDQEEIGGFYQIASGTQDGKAVQDLLRSLCLLPLLGSGWRVVIINEADRMTRQAETIWLDGLERLPGRVCVVFTTNELGRLSDRMLSRCEVHEFAGNSEEFVEAIGEVVRNVWKSETGKTIRRLPEGLGCFETASGEYSMRLALQQIAKYSRNGQKLPRSFCVPIVREVANGCSASGSAAAKKAWETRRRKETANV
jgi:replication-associated recombination protein RarA